MNDPLGLGINGVPYVSRLYAQKKIGEYKAVISGLKKILLPNGTEIHRFEVRIKNHGTFFLAIEPTHLGRQKHFALQKEVVALVITDLEGTVFQVIGLSTTKKL